MAGDMTPEQEVDKGLLMARRNRIYAMAQTILDRSQAVTAANWHMYKGSYNRLSNTVMQFDQVQEDILKFNVTIPAAENIAVDTVQKSFDELVEVAQMNLLKFDKPAPPTPQISADGGAGPANSASADAKPRMKLPQLNIPKFSGNLADWPPFYSMYKVVVHDAPITNAEKFARLLALVEGEPFDLIKTLTLEDKNYPGAFKLLEDRYQNEKRFVYFHFSSLLELPALKSGSEISSFLSKLQEHTHALDALGYKDSQYGPMLVTVIHGKLSQYFRRRLDDFRDDALKYPTITEVLDFLKMECSLVFDSMPVTASNSKGASKDSKIFLTSSSEEVNHGSTKGRSGGRKGKAPPAPQSNINQQALVSQHGSNNAPKKRGCSYCTGKHYIFRCSAFRQLNPQQRRKFVEKESLCFNCLGPHKAPECASEGRCSIVNCNKKHNSLLHLNESSTSAAATSVNNSVKLTAATAMLSGNSDVTNLLPTAQVVFSVPHTGQKLLLRTLLDSCAQRSFLTLRCAQLLRLKPKREIEAVSGLAENSVPAEGTVKVHIHNKEGEIAFRDHNVVVVRRLTGFMPSVPISCSVRPLINGQFLADPVFDQPGQVDALIGADLFSKVVTGAPIDFGMAAPAGLPTIFGLTLIGPSPCVQSTQNLSAQPVTLLTQSPPSLHELMERLCKLDEEPPAAAMSPEHKAAEDKFSKTTIQLPNGHYQVRLPFKEDHPPLGASRGQAEIRFAALERRFEKDPSFKEDYCQFMQEYEAKGYMSPAPVPKAGVQHAYLPHHGVTRASSSTTRLRVVFDASAPTTNSVSLNDVLLSGPPLQKDIRKILINFRRHAVTFTGDVKKMFLQVELHPDDRRFQLIVWRSDRKKPLGTYSLNTVTFGVTSSPFLSSRTIEQLVADHGHKYPRAARILLEAIYVDDIVSGADSVAEARELLEELIALLACGGFELRKWTSSHPDVLAEFPAEDLECPCLDDPDNPRFSVLGLDWIQTQDSFTYKVNLPVKPNTKRGAASALASIYDPCGFISPIVFLAKVFLQKLWIRKISWDDPLPAELKDKWNLFISALPALKELKIPRILHHPDCDYEAHGFCDASEAGYSCCIYLRSAPRDGSPASLSLVISKTRVAPLKPCTIPRLELCGAALLADTLDAYLPLLNPHYNLKRIVCWTDSTVVLAWLNIPAYQLKTFVSHRVAKIQNLKVEVTWYHIRSQYNPADAACRGVPPDELKDLELWWKGPTWLSESSQNWPIPKVETPEDSDLEIKSEFVMLTAAAPELFAPVSSTWKKTVKVYSWINRYFNCLQKRAILRRSNPNLPPLKKANVEKLLGEAPLLAAEVDSVRLKMFRLIQYQYFKEDMQRLAVGKRCSRRVGHLTPFIDDQGLMRVGGRLRHALTSEESKHPILLPSKHPWVRSLVKHYHVENLHAGPQLLQATISREYWILSARNILRSCVHNCVQCFRVKPTNATPLMGDLPPPRVQPNAVFLHCGSDFCGPFPVKIHLLRSARVVDMYVCIFVCFSTKCVHIETVQDLTAPAFLAAFHRFVARRGCPSDFYTDCGKNYEGAANELKRLLRSNDEDIKRFAEDNKVNFHFNPPGAPHQGGLWESVVKSMKSHLKRVIGSAVLRLEEFQTLTCRVEAMLNSRPLTPLSNDPNDLQPLTPGHFLVGRALNSPPETLHPEEDIPRLQRWRLVSALSQHFWRRWHLEYIHTLQPRGKWTQDPPPLKIGALVLIHEPNMPPLKWKLGRVTATHPGADGRVRVATVKTANGELKRPVHKLYPLPVEA